MTKYLQYKIQDFAEDSSFINWVHQSNREDIQFWENWIQNNTNKLSEINAAKLLVKSLSSKKEINSQTVEDEIWKKIKAQTQATPIKKPTIIRRLWPVAAAAAIALLVFFNLPSTTLDDSFDTVFTTELAQKEIITLPDGSIVTINADSRLEYDKKSWSNKRAVFLYGEGFFEVEKGSKFVVYTDAGQVEVLGTSFNIFIRGNEMDVICETGKVRVSNSVEHKIITPQQSVHVNDKYVTMYNASDIALNRSSWRKNIYSFKASELKDVLADLERNFDYSIISTDSIKNQSFSGSFNGSDLELALEEICYPLKLKYDIKKDTKEIIITQ